MLNLFSKMETRVYKHYVSPAAKRNGTGAFLYLIRRFVPFILVSRCYVTEQYSLSGRLSFPFTCCYVSTYSKVIFRVGFVGEIYKLMFNFVFLNDLP